MLIKNTNLLPAFLAGDLTQIKELLHPKNDGIELNYSLALATLEVGESSLPHRLVGSSEVYFLLEGAGEMHLDEQVREVAAGDLIFIPANALQFIKNTGGGRLAFLCIVSPPWSPEDEELAVSY